jgi:hypothetical protein
MLIILGQIVNFNIRGNMEKGNCCVYFSGRQSSLKEGFTLGLTVLSFKCFFPQSIEHKLVFAKQIFEFQLNSD